MPYLCVLRAHISHNFFRSKKKLLYNRTGRVPWFIGAGIIIAAHRAFVSGCEGPMDRGIVCSVASRVAS
jgi:hypothetical protein